MEIFLNKQLLKSMLCVLCAVYLLTITVQAQQPPPPYCDGKAYPLQFQAVAIRPDDSGTVVYSDIRLIATRKLRLMDAVISYELYYPIGVASPIIEKIPFNNCSDVRNVSPNQQFNIRHTHPWPLTPRSNNFIVQISRRTRTGAVSVLICLLFTYGQ